MHKNKYYEMDETCTAVKEFFVGVGLVTIRNEVRSWSPVALPSDITVGELLEIVDDALCHGFEFKVENHVLYTRL